MSRVWTWRRWPALALLCVAPLALGAPLPASEPSELVPNYRLLEPGLAAAGQPSAAGLEALQRQGFKTIVNLRSQAENAEAERAPAEAAGLRYISVPVTTETLSLDDARRVAAVLADEQARPVLLHCASSNRVGGVLALVKVLERRPLEEALEAGRQAGLKSPALEEAVRRVAGTAH